MDIKKLRDQLIIDEGIRYYIYLDTKNLPTCGIGHLITKKDPEYKQPIGTKVSKERAFELFEQDIKIVADDCNRLLSGFLTFPEEVQQIFANMMFNMGINRLGGFKNFIAAIKKQDYRRAAVEMIDSAWYKQVKGRSERLKNRMVALADCSVSNATI